MILNRLDSLNGLFYFKISKTYFKNTCVYSSCSQESILNKVHQRQKRKQEKRDQRLANQKINHDRKQTVN